MPPTVGARIDDYKLVAFVGSGRTSDVYSAVALSDIAETGIHKGQRLAIKFYNLWVLQQAFSFERIGRELAATAALTHDGLVRIYDFQISPLRTHRTYMVMELVQGEDFYSYLEREGPVPSTLARDYARQLFSTLAALHAAGIIHRDVKPENLLVTSTGRLKLMDFGVIKDVDAQGRLTGTSQFLGTIRYAAPEHLLGSDCTPRADIYSAAAVVYFALYGRELVRKDLPFGQQVMAVANLRVALHTLDPDDDVEHRLRDILLRCLDADPNERFRSAEEALEALDAPMPVAARRMTTRRPEREGDSVPQRRVNPAFMKPLKPDAALGAVVGRKRMPRTEVTKRLWNYIQRNRLQDPTDRRMVNADAKLIPVFNGRKRVSLFEMTKLVASHLD